MSSAAITKRFENILHQNLKLVDSNLVSQDRLQVSPMETAPVSRVISISTILSKNNTDTIFDGIDSQNTMNTTQII
jgi:hypothetical protein